MEKQLNNTSRLRRFVYTLNNYTDEDIKAIKSLPNIRAQTFGRETGALGTKHLQGAVLLDRPVRFTTLKKALPKAHIERMRGTPQQAFEYCWKEDTQPYKFGEMPQPGKRNDLKEAVARIQDGETVESLAMDPNHGCVLVKFSKGMRFLENCVNMLKPLNQKKIMWLYGPTGIGKTRSSIEFAEDNNLSYWISNTDLKWFDGYHGQDVAILDDFRWKHCSFSFLLRLLDRYELNVPVKGNFVRWNPKVIFITTPLTVDETFRTDWRKPEDLRQIHRRIDFEWDMTQGKPNLILESFKAHALPLKCDDEELISNPTEVHMPALISSESEAEDEDEDADPYERFSQGLIPDDRCPDCRWTFNNCICEDLDEGDIFFGSDFSSQEVC